MGRFNPYQLTDWHRDHGAALVDPNRSVPIGRHRKVSTVQATLVHIDNATVVYGDEVKLNSIQGCPMELPEEVGEMFGVKRLTGWLIFTDDKKYRNHDLIVTEFPARNLYFESKLRPPSHHKKSEVVKAFRKALEKTGLTDPVQAIAKGLSTLSFQPFETNPEFASAWLIEPKRIEELAITQRSRKSKIRSEGIRRDKIISEETMNSPLRGNFDPEKAEWSLGICKDINLCRERLERNEEEERLLEKTEHGELFENYRDSKLPGKGPVFRFLRAIAVDVRRHVFNSAVMTALAGIDESIYPDDSKDSPRPVMKQVKLLYHQFMYALVKRCDLSALVVRTIEIPTFGAMPSSEAVQIEREKMEEMGETLRPLGRDVVVSRMEETVDETDGPDEILARLILSVPEEWGLSKKIMSWLHNHQQHFSKSIQDMIDERLLVQEKS
jgi:hypothetical protein